MRHKYLYEDFKGQRLLYNVEGNKNVSDKRTVAKKSEYLQGC